MRHVKYVLLAVLMILPFASGLAQTKKAVVRSGTPVVEVLYFHGPQRCRTCVALQKAAKELLNAEFASDMKAGRVRFREIDLSSEEGERLGDRYEVAWSSLVVVRKQGGKEKVADLTDDGFRYAVKDKARIQTIIRQKIKEFLK